MSEVPIQDFVGQDWGIGARCYQAAMRMEEGRNIGGQCPSRPYPFGTVISPEVLNFRGCGFSEGEKLYQNV